MREEFDRVWPMLKPSVQRYGDTQRKRHVWQAIESGHAQLWPLPNAALVTQIDIYPTGLKECRAWLAGGELDEIVAITPEIEAWARKRGCTRAVIFGRRGWGKALTGYREMAVTYAKDL